MTETSIKPFINFIGEFLSLLWLLLAFFVSVIVLLGQKLETITMPSFHGLSFGQKPKEGISESEDVNGGFLNRKIVVEKVKNVFGKSLKSKEKIEDEDLAGKKVMRILQNNNIGKKCVTFAERDEVINEIASEFETSTSFREEDEPEDKSVFSQRETQVKNLLFHEIDENFKPDQFKTSNYSNVGFWKNANGHDDSVTSVASQELPKPPTEPPPLPPKLCQKFSPKARPSVPPPLPPKTITETKPPAIRRDLKKSKGEVESSVAELVSNFVKLRESVSPEELESCEGKLEKRIFLSEETKPKAFVNHVKAEEKFQEKLPESACSVNNKSETVKKDWKETFFQPVNKSFVSNVEKKPKVLLKNGIHAKSSKIPKLVEEMMEKTLEKKTESFDSETLRKCRINVSSLVNNFEQIQKESNKNGKFNNLPDQKTNGVTESNTKSNNWILNGKNEPDESGGSRILENGGKSHSVDSEVNFFCFVFFSPSNFFSY